MCSSDSVVSVCFLQFAFSIFLIVNLLVFVYDVFVCMCVFE